MTVAKADFEDARILIDTKQFERAGIGLALSSAMIRAIRRPMRPFGCAA